MELLWSPTALEHLRRIYDRIVPDNPVTALAVQDAIDHTARLLQDNPRLGRRGRVAGTREMVVPAYPTYILVYEIAGGHIHMLAVMHGKQQWPESFAD
jgi:plasmid stabilization system protein ParE